MVPRPSKRTLQKGFPMLASDVLRGLRVRLFSVAALIARHSMIFRDFSPNF